METLVDADLQGNYIEDEVEQLIQVALLCTQGSPMERPKMSDVVRMLEGDGLAERWEEWQKEEMFRQEVSLIHHHPNTNWIVDSTSHVPPDELSGPRWSLPFQCTQGSLFPGPFCVWKWYFTNLCIIFCFYLSSLYHILELLDDVISVGHDESSGDSEHGWNGCGSTHIIFMY